MSSQDKNGWTRLIGPLVTVVVCAVPMLVGYGTVQGQVNANSMILAEVKSSMTQMENSFGTSRQAHDQRLRALETRSAVDGEQIRALRGDIEEIKQGQDQIEGLLRQLLQRSVTSR